jgi:hypothetical protein
MDKKPVEFVVRAKGNYMKLRTRDLEAIAQDLENYVREKYTTTDFSVKAGDYGGCKGTTTQGIYQIAFGTELIYLSQEDQVFMESFTRKKGYYDPRVKSGTPTHIEGWVQTGPAKIPYGFRSKIELIVTNTKSEVHKC